MSFVFLIVGAILTIAGVRGTTEDSVNGNGDGRGLFPLVKGDFEGTGQPHGFLVWFVAILVIGALGYVSELKPFANAMLALVIVVLLLSNKGFFAQLQNAIQSPANAPTASTSGPGAIGALPAMSMPGLGMPGGL